MRRLIPTIALALLPAIVFAQTTKPLPWQTDPLRNSTVPWQKIETADGYAVLWAYQKDAKLWPFEVHCIKDICTVSYLAQAAADALTDPARAFWSRAKTSTCFDPKGYWPTAQERNLCAAVRKAWVDWRL